MWLWAGLVLAAPYRGAEGQVIEERDGRSIFQPSPLPSGVQRTDAAALQKVAVEALRLLSAAPGDLAIGPGLTTDLGWTLEDTRATLELIAGATPSQLVDPTWLNHCLNSFAWTPDDSRFRLTRYLVYEVEGRKSPEGDYQYALYGLPTDEAGLSEAEAEARKAQLLRYRYTRQEVAVGVYREGGEAAGQAPPLVWLTHPDHEQAILQGSVSVHFPDSSATKLYNVYRSNGIPYDRRIRDTLQQRRYWYFRELDRIRGWGKEPVPGIALEPMAAVAGDLYNLGLGRLMMIQAADGLRLVVLADTGGAFQPNLHQLDLYTGVFPSFAQFSSATSSVGNEAKVWLLRANPECRNGTAAPSDF